MTARSCSAIDSAQPPPAQEACHHPRRFGADAPAVSLSLLNYSGLLQAPTSSGEAARWWVIDFPHMREIQPEQTPIPSAHPFFHFPHICEMQRAADTVLQMLFSFPAYARDATRSAEVVAAPRHGPFISRLCARCNLDIVRDLLDELRLSFPAYARDATFHWRSFQG